MDIQPENFYHLYNRGNNKKKLFFNRDNYIYFLWKIRKSLKPCCDILAYCLMPNHYHFLIYSNNNPKYSSIPRRIGTIQSSYSQAINSHFNWTGSLFQQKAKAKVIECKNDELFICFNYIHQNPLSAGLVNKLEDWEYSSFKDYVGLRNGTLVSYDLSYEFIDLPQNQTKLKELSYKVIGNNRVRNLFD